MKKRNRKGRTSEREVRGEALEHIQIIKPYFKEMLNSCISNEVWIRKLEFFALYRVYFSYSRI